MPEGIGYGKDYTSIMKDEDKIKLEEAGMGFAKIPAKLREKFMKKKK